MGRAEKVHWDGEVAQSGTGSGGPLLGIFDSGVVGNPDCPADAVEVIGLLEVVASCCRNSP